MCNTPRPLCRLLPKHRDAFYHQEPHTCTPAPQSIPSPPLTLDRSCQSSTLNRSNRTPRERNLKSPSRTTSLTYTSCSFSTTTCLQKKGGKAAREEKQAATKSKDSKDASTDDPFDFSALEADITNTIERLKNDLSKLRAGGRFNPEVQRDIITGLGIDGCSHHQLSFNRTSLYLPYLLSTPPPVSK